MREASYSAESDMSSAVKVDPMGPVSDAHVRHDAQDIWSFIAEDQWPTLVTIFLTDDAEGLRSFQANAGFDWRGFLLSCDTKGLKRQCPQRFKSYDKSIRVSRRLIRHPYPSNPFLLAVMYDARSCCKLIKESAEGLDLSAITESGFTAYHTLFGGLDIIKVENRSEVHTDRVDSYLKYFLHEFFAVKQVTRMSTVRNSYYMCPLEWGIFCGYADAVDELLYRSHLSVVHCGMSGLMEHVELDFSAVVNTGQERAVSLLSVMAEVYGESRVAELGVFRRPLVLAPLIYEFYARHRVTVAVVFLFTLLDVTLLLASCDGSYRSFVASACSPPRPPPPGLFLVSRSVLMGVRALLLAGTLLGRVRKNLFRKRVGFPSSPRQADRDSLVWLVPNCLSIFTEALLIALLSSPDAACGQFGAANFRPLTGSLVLVDLLQLACILVITARLLPIVSKFFNSFYRSFAMFANFIVIYVLMLVIFSRLFQVADRTTAAPPSSNSSLAAASAPELDALSALYRTFLITLNVFDTATFQPNLDRTDLMLVHIAFILLVPVMFINFVVGVLSSIVATTMQYEVECRYLLRLSFAEYCEATLFWLLQLWELIVGKRQLVLSICRPLIKNSRCICRPNDE